MADSEEFVQDEVIDDVVEEVKNDDVQEEEREAAKEEVKEEHKEDPIPRGVQKRIDRAVRQKYEAEARAKAAELRLEQFEKDRNLRNETSSEEAPKVEDFGDDYVAFSRALARYEARQEIQSTLTSYKKEEAERKAQEAQARTSETWAKRAAAAKAEMPDFDEVIASSDVQFKDPNVLQAIAESELGPKIAYYLASNPDEADEIADMTGAAAIRAIGRLEAKLKGGKASVTRTPAPITPVGQRAKAEKSPNEMTNEEFAKWRKKIIAQRGSR